MAAGPASWMLLMMVMMTTQGSVNDSLDLLDSKAYWQQAKVETTVDALAAQLDAKVEGEPAPAASVRKLMAIRALGELKDKAALAKLTPLLADTSPFVAEYAKAAIARIEGKPFTRPEPSKEQLDSDLALLPSGCAVVAQMRVTPGSPLAWDKLAEMMKAMVPEGDELPPAGLIRADAAKGLSGFLAMTGNFRVEAVTLGVSGDMGPGKGFFAAVVRGAYDAGAVRESLKSLMAGGGEKVDGVDCFFRQRRNGVVLSPSADRLILLSWAGPDDASIEPLLKELLASLKSGKGGLDADKEMKALVASVDRSVRLWAVARIAECYRRAELVAPFDTVTFSATEKDGATTMTLVARGRNQEKTHAAVAMFEEERKKALAEMDDKGDQTPPPLKPIVDRFTGVVRSVKVVEDGAQATVTAKLEGTSMPWMLVTGFMPMSFHAEAHVAAPEPVPPPRSDPNE